MLGTTDAKSSLRPSGSQAQHNQQQSKYFNSLPRFQPIPNFWPLQPTVSTTHTGSIYGRVPSLEFQTNGEVTESLLTTGGYHTPQVNVPLLPLAPLELVTNNFHSTTASASFSQDNSVLLQSHTDFFGRKITTKKTETCYGRWQQQTLGQVQVPPLTAIKNLTINSENINSGRNSSTSHYHHGAKINGFEHFSTSANPFITEKKSASLSPTPSSGSLSPVIPSGRSTNYTLPDIKSGCSRTIPFSWTSSGPTATSSTSLLHIKREPCQVSEITTSNCFGRHYQQQSKQTQLGNQHQQTVPTVVQFETTSSSSLLKRNNNSIVGPSTTAQIMDHNNTNQSHSNAIPVGIAVARQRLQEHAQQHHQPKDLNRYGIGVSAADFGGATSAFSQNMFFAGTNSTMIPFSSDAAAVTMGVSNAMQNAMRTPPTLWQYPTSLPVESMLHMPMPIPPVGFQLIRDPNSGQFLFLPATTMEPFQQAVVWPTYTQPQTTVSATPHLLMPPLTTHQMHPPPLAPLLLGSSDYLAASTTMHQQTQSTRLVALSSEGKRSKESPTVPMPMQSTPTLIKIEDCSPASATARGSLSFGDLCANPKPLSTSTLSSSVQTNEITPNSLTHLNYYQTHGLHGSLVQIAPQTAMDQNRSGATTGSLSRSMAPASHIYSPIPTIAVTSVSCLTPPSEQFSRSDLDSSGISSIPEVQDATIQTDTPLMSEDDNTNGADDSAFSSNVIINHQISLTEELNISVPTSNSCYDSLTHPLIDFSCERRPTRPSISDASPEMSPSFINLSTQNNEIINNKNNTNRDSMPPMVSIATNGTSPCRQADICFDASVTSTKILKDEQEPMYRCRTVSSKASSPLYDPESTNTIHSNENNNRNIPQNQEKDAKIPSPDISGLELLSNSIEAFEKHTFIKQEPSEKASSPIKFDLSPIACTITDNKSPDECQPCSSVVEDKMQSDFVEAVQPLGGLNLLCALAEQRFQEEVGHRSDRKRSSSSDISEPKQKKHKHSSKKSKKRERKEKKRRGSHLPLSGDGRDMVVDDVLEKDLKETYDRVKGKYLKCKCQKNGDVPDENCCCRSGTNWPSAEEVYSAMKSDMRNRLMEITREVQQKKRKLEAMNSKESRRHRESTPSSIKSSSSSTKISASLPTLSPSILSTSSLDCNQNSGNDFATTTKIASDTDSCSSVSLKQNTEIDVTTKKNTSLVGYIFASKKKQNDGNFSTTDEASVNSDISATLKRVAAIKQESFEFEDSSSLPDSVTNPFGGIITEDIPSTQHIFGSTIFANKEHKRKHCTSPKHHKKSSNNKERKRHRRSSDMHERKRLIDEKCTLTTEYLDNLVNRPQQRVLTAMGGLFYAGSLNAVQPPDVYAVKLDGERGNRPHILSREEILRDAILEVAPKSADEVPPTTRLCAYWSQQYRCLYPGMAATNGTPEHERDPKFVSVEFDDGDSGRIALEDIRFLISSYPIVEYDPNPLLSIGKKKQRMTHENTIERTANKEMFATSEPSTSLNCFNIREEPTKNRSFSLEEKEAHRERRRLKKIRKNKLRQLQMQTDDPPTKRHKHKHKCGDELCKHRKHKKRRKHKKHNRDINVQVESPPISCVKKESNAEEDEADTVEGSHSKKHLSHFDERLKTNAIVVLNTNDCKINIERKRQIHVPLIKEEKLTEEDVITSHTEDSTCSSYNPESIDIDKQISSGNHSRIAAFLPARQLWAWSGKGFKRNATKGARNKRLFYKSIQRGKETISVGDSAVFLSTGRPDRPYIGQIESLWETTSNNKVVKVKWYYHPEETDGCPELAYPGALFESPHEDENDVQTISHKCEVLPFKNYTKKYGSDPKKYISVYDNNDTFYLSGYYDPTTKNLKMENDIPISKNKSKT